MRLGDTKFFNLFALIASTANPDRSCHAWQVGPVSWSRQRSSFNGPRYAFQMDVHTLRCSGRQGWCLIVGRETWWEEGRKDPFRNGQWVHVSQGRRKDVEKWFSEQEALF